MSFRRTARSLLHTALLITAPTAAAGAQDASTTVIRAARLIVGDGTVIEQPVVIVRGDRIVEAGPASRVTVPRGAKVIELAGHTLLPGFIDTHTHLTSIDSDGGDLAAIQETAAHAGIWAAVNARKTLDAGFTAVREAGAPGFADVAAKSAIARGIIPGPRIFAAGAALGILGGHADVNGYSPEVQLPGTGTIVNGVDEVRQTVRHHVKYGADQIKIVATGGILSQGDAPTASQFSDAELREAVSEAARLGRKVMAHAHGGAEGGAGGVDARAGDEAAGDGVAYGDVDVAEGTGLAHRGEARLEGLPGVDGGVDGAMRRGLAEGGEVAAVVVDRREVRVRVDEAREEGLAREVDDPGAGGDAHLRGGADGGDAVPLHEHGGVRDLSPVTDDDAVGAQRGDGRGLGGERERGQEEGAEEERGGEPHRGGAR